MNSAGVKWVSGYPGNPAKGLPYINGLLIFNDTETGLPKAVMDCSWITAMRTAAASALSAKYLARQESSSIGILACGVQGRTNLEAMNVLFPLKKVYAFDTLAEQTATFTEYAQNTLGLEVEIVEDPRKAVTGCDIVVTSGPILGEARAEHATLALPGGEALIVGGRGAGNVFAARINLDSGQETPVIGMPTSARVNMAAISLGSGQPLLLGGIDPSDGANGSTQASAELYFYAP